MAEAPQEDTGPRPLQASLDAVSRSMGQRDAEGHGRLFAHWGDIVGPAMAAHVTPVRLDEVALVVTVDHPAWATQVRLMGDELLDRVSVETGAPRPARMEVRVRR